MLNPYEDHPYYDPKDLSDILYDATSKLECLAKIVSWCGWKQDEYEVLLHNGEHFGDIIGDYVRVVKNVGEKMPSISEHNPGLLTLHRRALELEKIIKGKGETPDESRDELKEVSSKIEYALEKEILPLFGLLNSLRQLIGDETTKIDVVVSKSTEETA